jgi:FkbM family methyltransferase
MQASGSSATEDPHDIVAGLYRLLLGREADAEGLAHHARALAEGGDVLGVVAALAGSPEFAARTVGTVAPRPAPPATALPPLTTPITIVDLGAQLLDDQTHAYAPLADAGYATHVIGFEPLADRLEDRATVEAGQSLELLPHFVGDGSRRTFHINNYDATSSLFPFNTALTQQFVELKGLHTVRTEPADTRRLDDVLPDLARIDFLKLDIQGFELLALQHAEAALARTLVVHCEVSFAEVYAGQCYFSEIETLLRGHGFALIDLIHQHRGGYVVPSGTVIGDRLLWADAVFFKEPHHLDATQRAVQAVIAQHVYGKPALAERLVTSA